MSKRELAIWMNGERVGVWSWSRTGTHSLRYDTDWANSPNARPLSLSLPITAGISEISGPMVKNYFDNLLPDNDAIRERIRKRYQLKSANAQELLGAIGRDCVGAVQLLPIDVYPDGYDRIDGTPMADDDIERFLHSVTSDPVLGQDMDDLDDFRISIAGAQEKSALLRLNGQWQRPHGATPTTHILKLPLGLVGNMQVDMSTSVENEWLCSRIMKALGFNVANTEMATFGKQRSLVVERFDRKFVSKNTWIARLPQEDFCQATGTPPDQKYEIHGGPGIRACLDLLSASDAARHDKLTFIKTQLAFWLMAATDGQAKNYSVFLHAGGTYSMTPLYDILSAWPILGTGPNTMSLHRAKLAMALRSKNSHYKLVDIHTRHWRTLAQQSGIPDAFDAMVEMVEGIATALKRVEQELAPDFPVHVWASISEGMLAKQKIFQREI